MRNFIGGLVIASLALQPLALAQTSTAAELELVRKLKVAANDYRGKDLVNEQTVLLENYFRSVKGDDVNFENLVSAIGSEYPGLDQRTLERAMKTIKNNNEALKTIATKLSAGHELSQKESKLVAQIAGIVGTNALGHASATCSAVVGGAGGVILVFALAQAYKQTDEYPRGTWQFGWPNVFLTAIGSVMILIAAIPDFGCRM